MRKVLLIIPAFNEEASIEMVVDGLVNDYPDLDYVVVNDGSTDLTGTICRKRHYNYIDLPVNLGLTGAFRAGMKYAYYNGYDYAIQYDGDGQHNPEYIIPMQEYAEEKGLDVVIGSRFLESTKNASFRMFGNTVIQICILLTTGRNIKDPTSGMRLYNKGIIEKFSKMYNYGPEPDTIAYLMRCGARVGEYPVHMNEREYGESYLTFSNGVAYMFRMLTSILIVQWLRKKV